MFFDSCLLESFLFTDTDTLCAVSDLTGDVSVVID